MPALYVQQYGRAQRTLHLRLHCRRLSPWHRIDWRVSAPNFVTPARRVFTRWHATSAEAVGAASRGEFWLRYA